MACATIHYVTIRTSILVGEVQVIYQKPRATIHYATIRTSILGHRLLHLGGGGSTVVPHHRYSLLLTIYLSSCTYTRSLCSLTYILWISRASWWLSRMVPCHRCLTPFITLAVAISTCCLTVAPHYSRCSSQRYSVTLRDLEASLWWEALQATVLLLEGRRG